MGDEPDKDQGSVQNAQSSNNLSNEGDISINESLEGHNVVVGHGATVIGQIYQGPVQQHFYPAAKPSTKTPQSEIEKAFERETEFSRHLAIDKPMFWEYLLTAELLRSKLPPIKRQLSDLHRGLEFRRVLPLKAEDFFGWVRSKNNELLALLGLINRTAKEELPASWGPPGIAGNPLEIKQAVERLVLACREFVSWETEVRFVVFPGPFDSIRQKMQRWTSEWFDEIESIPDQLATPLNQPNPTGTISICLTFQPPPGLNEVSEELDKIQRQFGG